MYKKIYDNVLQFMTLMILCMQANSTIIFDGMISDELGIHRIENPSHTDNAVSLHLYCPPFDECQTFDQFTGHKRSAEVTFWSKFGKRTPFVCILFKLT